MIVGERYGHPPQEVKSRSGRSTSRALVVQPVRPTPLMTVLSAQMCIYAAESAPTCSEALRLYRATLARVPTHDDVTA